MTPPPRIERELTGRARVRPGWFGRQILQVEVRHTSYRGFDFERANPLSSWSRWRDATWEDMQVCHNHLIGPVKGIS
jgi:hypothetical protein